MRAIFNTYKLVRKHTGSTYIFILIESLITALVSPAIIYATAMAVDSILNYVHGERNLFPVILLILLFAWGEVSKFIRNILDIKLEQKLELNLNTAVMNKLDKISLEEIEKSGFQDKLNKVKDRPHMAVIELFNSSIAIAAIVVKVVGIAFVFFTISIYLGLAYMISAALDVFFSFKAVNNMNQMFENTSHNEREMENILRILKDKNAIYEIKVFQMKNLFLKKFKKYSEAVFDERIKTTIASQKYLLLSSFINIIWMGLAILFVILKLIQKAITVGSLTAVITSASTTLDMAEDFVYEASSVANSGYIAETLLYILDYDEKEIKSQIKSGDKIIFDKLSFKYPQSENIVLDDLSLAIDKNKVTAIVGENGAGKSTIIKLIAGLYKPSSGTVKINGTEPYYLSKKELADSLAIVYQDFQNYELSIKDNVLLGDDKDISSDLDLMALDKYDMNTNLGKLEDDGVYLSGGESQRLAIARAISKSSDFLIFDEPTASMDPMMEAKMYEGIIKVLKMRGAIIITHRLVLSKLADEVLVIDKGRLIERGNHETLMEQGGKYAKMFTEQAAWYKEAKND